jgi:hypothetical protein
MFADSSTGSGLYLQSGGVFLSSSLYVMAICRRIILFAKWSCLPIFAGTGNVSRDVRIQIMMGTQLLRVQLFRPLYHIFCTCRSLPLLSSAFDIFRFRSPSLLWRLLNLQSQGRSSLRQATAGRTLYPRDCIVLNLGNFHIGFLFTRCSYLLAISLHDLTRFYHLITRKCILYLSV